MGHKVDSDASSRSPPFRVSGRCTWVIFSRLIIIALAFAFLYSVIHYGSHSPIQSSMEKNEKSAENENNVVKQRAADSNSHLQQSSNKGPLHLSTTFTLDGDNGNENTQLVGAGHHENDNSVSMSNKKEEESLNVHASSNVNSELFSVTAIGATTVFSLATCGDGFLKKARELDALFHGDDCKTLVFSGISNSMDPMRVFHVDTVIESIFTITLNKTVVVEGIKTFSLSPVASRDYCAIERLESRASLSSLSWKSIIASPYSTILLSKTSHANLGESFSEDLFDFSNALLRASLLCFGSDEEQFRIHWAAGVVPKVSVVRLSVQIFSLNRLMVPSSLFTISIGADPVTRTGSVKGSPIIDTKAKLFLALEHPLSGNGRLHTDSVTVICGIFALPLLPSGKFSSVFHTIIGTYQEEVPVNQAFWNYLTAARASPPRPFLHYNSWFDFTSWQERSSSFDNRSMTAESCRKRVEIIGEELVHKRDVVVDSFLWDDGWDNHKSLWSFHEGFPEGFTPVSKEAKKINSGIGVWVSPWGGYGSAKVARLAYAKDLGYETNKGGFSLSGEKYFKRFTEIAMSMVETYGVNMFKFDGIGFSGNDIHKFASEVEGLLRFLVKLRSAAKKKGSSLWLNLTTGMWPSPFWLLYGDSIWRGYGDLGYHGTGSPRQQWITYRDAVVCKMIVMRARLFPLSALMLHGIVLGAVGESRYLKLDKVMNILHFEEEVWSYFAMGVQLQELYISPDKVPAEVWDVLSQGAKWARKNAHVLQLSHWVGGNAVNLELYGFVSQVGDDFILFVRNPADVHYSMSLGLDNAFGWPKKDFGATKIAFTCIFSTFSKECQNIWEEKESHKKVSCSSNKFNKLAGNTIYSKAYGSQEQECIFDASLIYKADLPPLGSFLLQGTRAY
eukprot:m.54151 g.54151  ORF g.54151 m.54151 type:complete len:901 (-) comp7705_c1_seq1:1359-4061(-)